MPILFGLQGQSHGIRNKGIPALLLGRIPLPATKLIISGVTKDSTGTVLANCSVSLYRTGDDLFFERVTSDVGGNYSFSAVGLSETYYVVAYKAGSPDVAGTTVNTLVGNVTGVNSGFDAAADTLFSAMTVAPDATRKGHINTLILALKAAGVWTKLDVLYVLAAHHAQAARLNWKSPGALTASEVASPTFTADRGYAGDGVSSYVQTGWAPSAGVNFLQDDASCSYWCNTDGPHWTGVVGCTQTTLINHPKYDNNNTITRINSSTALQTADTTAIGFFTTNRTSSTAVEHFQDAASKGTGSATSEARTATTMSIGAIVPDSQFTIRQVALVMAGGGRTSGEETATYNAIRAYMQAVGNA